MAELAVAAAVGTLAGGASAAGGAATFAAITTGIAATGATLSGIQGAQARHRQAQHAETQAKIANVQAMQRANGFRRELERDLASANAIFGARGVVSRTGTPGVIQVQSRANARSNIRNALFGGSFRSLSLTNQAGALRKRGQLEFFGGLANSALMVGQTVAPLVNFSSSKPVDV